MDTDRLVTLMQGANVMACLAIATFFARNWRRTGDAFFLMFGLAFAVFATNRFLLALIGERDEALWLYLVRLAAFVLIVVAIIVKNRDSRRPRHDA